MQRIARQEKSAVVDVTLNFPCCKVCSRKCHPDRTNRSAGVSFSELRAAADDFRPSAIPAPGNGRWAGGLHNNSTIPNAGHIALPGDIGRTFIRATEEAEEQIDSTPLVLSNLNKRQTKRAG